MKKISIFLLCVAVLFSCITLGGCGAEKTFVALGTEIRLKFTGGNAAVALKESESLLEKLEEKISLTQEDSDICKINASTAGEAVSVDALTMQVLVEAKRLCVKTDGAFNPLLLKLSELWHFSPDLFTGIAPELFPENAELIELVSVCTFGNITLDEENLTVTRADERVKIDLGGIAKGFSADAIKNICLKHGVEKAVINLGGNVYIIGNAVIAIGSPRESGAEYFATLSLNNASAVTSGDYHRYYEKDNVRYCHILDRSGKPTSNGLIAVTVCGESSVELDALSTACMSLGESEARLLLEKFEGVSAVFVREGEYSVYGELPEFKLKDGGYILA